MTKISEKIVFFGNERLATGVTTTAPVLSSLIESGYDVAAVIANHHDSGSRSTRQLEIANVANEHRIPLLMPSTLSEIKNELEQLGAEVGILAAYGKIVPQSIIDIFPRGIINLHPSLLPKHRGPTPLESVILDGSDLTGVSIMQLAKEMDAGPIFAQSEYPLSGSETKQQLADTLLDIGSAMLTDVLPGILHGTIVAMPQDETAATYDSLITKADGELNLTKSARVLEREVRAFLGWPGSHTKVGAVDIIVTAAHVSNQSEHALSLETSDNYLTIDRLKPAGKKEMSAEEFLRGYKSRLSS